MLGTQPLVPETPSGMPREDQPARSNGCELANAMVLRGAVGALTGSLAGAAVGRGKHQAIWAASGFFLGTTLGQYGIVGIMLAAVYQKLQEKD